MVRLPVMIGKILITLAVVGGAFLVLKMRAERAPQVRKEEAQKPVI